MSAAATASPTPLVRAAGGAVWRRGKRGIEVILVHRPRYDDWSLPKGKVDPGETDEEAALREVAEEASVHARLGVELVSTEYLDRSGKHKTVRYWAMTVADGDAGAANEVDVVEWLELSEARARLSYPRDTAVLDALAGAVGPAAGLQVTEVDHLVLHVGDVERSLRFYCGQLGLGEVRVDEWRRGEAPFASVRASAHAIVDLLGPEHRAEPGLGAVEARRGDLDHFCLVVRPTDLAAVAHSGAFEVLEGPAPRFGAQGVGTSLYIRDPDGYTVELRHYG